MMVYVDGFVAAVPTENRQAYIDMATKMADLFLKSGALRVMENWGDDVPEGTVTSMSMAVKRTEGEEIVFSWIEWPSREARDAGWKTCMEDPLMREQPSPPIFDGKRLIYGGFANVVQR